MGFTTPITAYLTHNATIRALYSTSKDSYWNPVPITSDTTVKCFVDFPKMSKEDNINNEAIQWDIRLFTEKDCPVKISDKVVSISSVQWEFVVIKIDPVPDMEWVHHLEVYLRKHG